MRESVVSQSRRACAYQVVESIGAMNLINQRKSTGRATNTLVVTGLAIGLTLSSSRIASAQAVSHGVFADAAVMLDRDPTDFFYGSPVGAAGRAAVGAQISEHSSLRFELDIPRWRVTDTLSTNPPWCAKSDDCVCG